MRTGLAPPVMAARETPANPQVAHTRVPMTGRRVRLSAPPVRSLPIATPPADIE